MRVRRYRCAEPEMRLPRYLMWLMAMSCLVAATVVGSWWTTWPKRTLSGFLEAMRDGRFAVANAMLSDKSAWEPAGGYGIERIDFPPPVQRKPVLLVSSTVPPTERRNSWYRLGHKGRGDFVLPAMVWQAWFENRNIKMHPPSAFDWIAGRRRFEAIEGNLEFLVDGDNISITNATSAYRFLNTRTSVAHISGGGVREVSSIVDEQEELAVLGPRE